MTKKRDVVNNTPELKSMLNNIQISSDGNVLLHSDQYLQLGCDLRDLCGLERSLSDAIDVRGSLVLLVAEVSITYMDVEAADALIGWAASLPYGKHTAYALFLFLTKTHKPDSAFLNSFFQMG